MKCDICGEKINGKYVDGKTRMGPWANMCAPCYQDHGIGLGIRRGQIYTVAIGDDDESAKQIEELEVVTITPSAICPKCGHYNALLAEWNFYGGTVMVCRDCGYKCLPAKATKKE